MDDAESHRMGSAPPSALVIALDLGGTKLASCLFGADGAPLERSVAPLGRRQGEAVAELIVGEVCRLQSAAVQRGAPVTAIGVSVPGIADATTGCVWAPNIPGWENFALRAAIQTAVGAASVRIVIDSDRAAYILGEAWQGAAQGCRDAIFLAVGTGIGAGVVADGRVLHGAHGIAGAVGWMALDRPFKAAYANCGCFETHASGDGLAKQLAATLDERVEYRGLLRDKGAASARDLFDAYEHGDVVAHEVLSQAVAYWGMATANLVSMFNPEKIIFGGGVFGPATRLLGSIADEARQWAQPISMERVALEASQLGSDAGLYGAGHLALFGSQLRSP